MSDKMAQDLSALLDNEASELDVRRLLKNMTDEDLKTWQNYCLMKDGINKESTGFESVDLLSGVRAGIADEVFESEDQPKSGWKNWIGGAGIAAAVAMAVVGLGIQNNALDNQTPEVATTETQPAETTSVPSDIKEAPAETRLAAADMSPEQYKALQDKLRGYMQHHAENSEGKAGDVLPYARVVNFEVQQENKQ
jgi:sigma-E factor negative regulatory protein RseA